MDTKRKKGVVLVNSCTEYSELLSAYADNELSDHDKQRMEDHLTVCESCASLLSIYREITSAAVESEVPAPDALRTGVMAAIEREQVLRTDVYSRRRKIIRTSLAAIIPLAACLAIALLTLPRFMNIDRSSDYDVMPADAIARNTVETSAAMYDNNTELSGESAYGGDPAPSMAASTSDDGLYSTRAGLDDESDFFAGGLAESQPNPPTDLPPDPPDQFIVGEPDADQSQPFDSAEPNQAITDDSINPNRDAYYAVITLTDDLPEHFTQIEHRDEFGYVYLARDEAKKLIEDYAHLIDYIEYGDETAELAIVYVR